MVILYSTGCPRCNVLKKKLDAKNVEYTIETDVDKMQSKGIKQAPMLEADGWMMDFKTAVTWVNEHSDEVL